MTGARALLNWEALAADYAQYHQTTGNQRCHVVGIPLIMLALIRWTQVWPMAPVPLVALLLPVYFFWDVKLALGMALEVAALSAVAVFMSPLHAALAFAAGWILQLAGHRFFEGRSPAFTKNIVHLLVGPAWILKKFLP